MPSLTTTISAEKWERLLPALEFHIKDRPDGMTDKEFAAFVLKGQLTQWVYRYEKRQIGVAALADPDIGEVT